MVEVIEAAFKLVRAKGWSGLTASAIAQALGSSTMPIYSHFKNMDKLQDEVVKKGWILLQDYEAREFTGDAWVDQAIGYINFAKQERQLFLCMFDGRNLKLHREMLLDHWRNLSRLIQGYEPFSDLDEERCLCIRYSRAMLSHGVATAVSMGYGMILEHDGTINEYLTDASQALLKGYTQIPRTPTGRRFSLKRNLNKIK